MGQRSAAPSTPRVKRRGSVAPCLHGDKACSARGTSDKLHLCSPQIAERELQRLIEPSRWLVATARRWFVMECGGSSCSCSSARVKASPAGFGQKGGCGMVDIDVVGLQRARMVSRSFQKPSRLARFRRSTILSRIDENAGDFCAVGIRARRVEKVDAPSYALCSRLTHLLADALDRQTAKRSSR